MRRLPPIVRLLMVAGVGEVALDVLEQRSSQHHVQQLHPPTNPQHRHVPPQRRLQERGLELVRPGFNAPRPWRAASPYASGGTSKAPPVTTRPEIRSRNASIIAGSLASGSTIGSPPARSTASAYGDFST